MSRFKKLIILLSFLLMFVVQIGSNATGSVSTTRASGTTSYVPETPLETFGIIDYRGG